MKLMSYNFSKKGKIILCAVVALIALIISSVIAYKIIVKPPIMTEKPSLGLEMYDEDGNLVAGAKTGDKYTILVAGRDAVGLNTDTIMVVSFDTVLYTIDVLSIPRDTMSSNVTRSVKKINAAYAVGGKANPEQLIKEVEQIIGFTIDRYAVVNLDIFVDIIDILGGIELNVEHSMNYSDPGQGLYINLSPGLQTLSGSQAMGYVRFRSTYAEGDIRRIENQKTFVEALANTVLQPSVVTKISQLFETVFEYVDTDFTLGEIAWMALEALNVDLENDFNTHTLPGYAGTAYGLSYYFVNQTEWLNLLNSNFNATIGEISRTDLNIQSSAPTGSNTATQLTEDEEELLEEELAKQDLIDYESQSETSNNNSNSSGSSSSSGTSSSSGSSSSGNSSSSSGSSGDTSVDGNTSDETPETEGDADTSVTPDEDADTSVDDADTPLVDETPETEDQPTETPEPDTSVDTEVVAPTPEVPEPPANTDNEANDSDYHPEG